MANFTPMGVEAQIKGLGAFTRGLGKMDKSIQATGKTAAGIGKSFTGLGKSVLGFGAVLGKVAVGGVALFSTAIVGLGGFALKAASDYESAFAGVIKTTDGLVDGMGELTELGQELSKGFRELSKTVPISPEQLAAIGELGGQLGITSDNLLDFSETIAALDVATNLTAEEAALELAKLSNVMGTSQEDISRMAASIVLLGNNTETTERDILNFASRIAGAGKIAGLTEADLFGIGAAMSSVGVEAEAGGTAVQKVLLAMNEAVLGGAESFRDNSAAIDKAGNKLVDLTARLNIANLKQGEFTEKTKASTRAANAARITKLTRQITEQRGELEGLIDSHGQLEEASGQISVFARTAGLDVEKFKEMWETDAGGAFQAFVEGLGAQGDNALGTLKELGLEDQRLIRAFLSLAGAGDTLSEGLKTSSKGWEDNVAHLKEADARYGTFESQVQILKNSLRDIAITVGQPLLKFFADVIKKVRPIINEFGKKLPGAVEVLIGTFKSIFAGADIGEALSAGIGDIGELFGIPPDVIAGFDAFAQKVVEVGRTVISALGTAFTFLQTSVFPVLVQAIQFVIENWDTFKTVLIAIGAVLAGAAIAAAIAGIAAAIASLFSPIGIIIAVVAALAAAWSSNFLGIRDILTEFWENTGRPIFEQVIQWLQVNIPIAIQALATFWTGTLQPALATVWSFIQNSVIPVLSVLWTWLATTVPAALRTLATFWQTVLLPAIRVVWGFIKDNIIPLLGALANVWLAVVKKELELLAGIWQNIVLPALRIVWAFIQDSVIPVLSVLGEAIGSVLGPIIEGFVSQQLGNMVAAFEAIGGAIQVVIGFLNDMATRIGEIQLPEFLQPGSPTPFEMGLRGIGEALTGVVAAALAAFAASAMSAFKRAEQRVTALRKVINNISTVTLPKLMSATQATTQRMVASFTAVVPAVDGLARALADIYRTTLPTLDNVTRQTTTSMASSFRGVIPSVNSLGASIALLTGQVTAFGAAATAAADTMKTGFVEAKSEIGNLITELGNLVTKLNAVTKAANAAAAANAAVGSGDTGGGGGGVGGQRGLDMIVPPGFPRDTFPVRASSKERLIIIPPGQPGAAGGPMSQNVFNLNVSTRATAGATIAEFEIMRALSG